jgi:voltage-gated potassium channel
MRYTASRRAAVVISNNLKSGFFLGGVMALGLLIVCSFAFFFFENSVDGDPNPDVRSIIDGFAWVTRTLFQGEPPFEPLTGVGSFLFYVVVITGVGIIAIVTAAIASKIIQWVMRKDSGMGQAKYSEHIVICGWSPKGDEILRELHSDEVLDKRPVAILAPLAQNPTEDDLVTFIHGHSSDAHALKRAGIEHAETAIVLADESNPSSGPDERDAMTLLTALAVESINPNVHTCVEVIRSENLQHFSRAGVDEVVVSAELTGNILAASAVTHGLSGVVADLTGHASGNEFYGVDAPSSLRGRTFGDALPLLKTQADALLIGVASDGIGFDLNPKIDRVLQEGDRLLMIAGKDPGERVERMRP